MIVRSWRGRTDVDRADIYPKYLFDVVVPKLGALSGFGGISLLRRVDGNEIEFVVQTYWQSMQAVEGFAGPKPEIAVVEPDARDLLTSFD
ncbi:MAG TPA: hypothetical protein VK636_02090, partial [Gemmatimonadaceae bacterium]|nr:hypothetical protein [Gemmatimonadaceae bacterium]